MLLVIIASFVGVACLVGGIAFTFRGSENTDVEDRLSMLAGTGGTAKAGKVEANLLSTFDESVSLSESMFLQQADVPMSPTQFGVATLVMGIAPALAYCVTGLPIVAAPAIAVCCAPLPFLYVMFKRKMRLSAFGKQLPEALELIGRALRAGHSLASGFHLVAEDMKPPISTEFSRCFEAQNLGQPLEEAIEEMTDRVPNLDLRFFATAVILQRQTGGDLAEILDKIGHLVRERFKIYGQIQALTGEGRMSGAVLLGLPPVLFIVMYRMNPDYCMVLFTDPMGQQMLGGAIALQILGAVVIKKIIDIKV
jgi:tight adherence protein B